MLNKIGSKFKITKTAAAVEELLIERPLEEKVPSTSKIIEPKNEQFLYLRARAISSYETNGANGNHDAFGWDDLLKSYSSFQGRGLYVDHEADSVLKAVGRLIDSYPVEDPETGEKYIEVLAKIDKYLFPELSRQVQTGVLSTVSMGCSVDDSTCSVCGTTLHSDADERCEHLEPMSLGREFVATIDNPKYKIAKGQKVKAMSLNSGITFNELSLVGVPADPTAIVKTILSNMRSQLQKKASLSPSEQADFVKQFENLLTKVDNETSIKLKAEFCGICPPIAKEAEAQICTCGHYKKQHNREYKSTKNNKQVHCDKCACNGYIKDQSEQSKESSMADKNVLPNDEQKKILSKISALEMEQLESYVAHKTKKANEIVNKEVLADSAAKEESFLSKIVAKVKDALASEKDRMCSSCKDTPAMKSSLLCQECKDLSKEEKKSSISAKFQEVKNSFAAELLEKKIETVAKEELGKKDCYKCQSGWCEAHGIDDSKDKKISAKFQEDKNNVLASTWSISQNGNILIEASLKDIWGSKFETLSFEDQKWATSEAYAKEAVSRLLSDGLPKLAYYWDVQNKITKTAANGEFFKAHDFFVPGSDSDNNWKAEDIKKSDEKDGHVATEYTFKFPGQVDSRGGLNSSGITTINMEYNFKRQEGSDFVGGSDSSNNYKPDEVKSADEGNKGGYGHVKTEYSFKRQPGKEFVGGSDSSNNMTPEEIKRASLKTASEPKLGPSGPRATPTTGLSNKKHDYLTTPKFTDPKPGVDSKGPAAPAGKDVKIEYKIDMPGQEAGQKGPAAPKPMAVKTDYSEPKPETEGKEVTTTPKNPDEKAHEKSEKEVKTDYVAEGKEHMEEEEKENKKVSSINYKQANSVIKWSAMSPEAQEFIKKHVKKHMDEDGMKQDQAVAAAYSEAREKGFDVPSKKATQETDMKKQAADKDAQIRLYQEGNTWRVVTQNAKGLWNDDLSNFWGAGARERAVIDAENLSKALGLPFVGRVTEISSKETKVEKQAADKDAQIRLYQEGNTWRVVTQNAKGLWNDDLSNFWGAGARERAVIDAENLSKALGLPFVGRVTEISSKETKVEKQAADKDAATEMPMPEDKDPMSEAVQEEVMVDEKPAMPAEAPKAEMSAFDKAEKLDIGEGYSAHKDKESHEVIISKDGKEVKRLPDGFGADPKVVVDLMKSVLGLPPEANNNMDMPDMTAPMGKEEPKMEEHPALEEAHEDELGIKESSLKAKEAELLKKEAALKAIEEKAQKAEASKKFASILQARSERCKQIVATMVDKDALKLDKEVYETEIKLGTYLLDAQKKAFESAINAKHKELIAMDDLALKAMEKVVEELPVQSNVNTKKANKIWASPTFNAELSEDEELAKIFKTMGNSKQRPQ